MNAVNRATADNPSPFHDGEKAVQILAGVREEAEKRGQRMLTPDLNPPQRAFFRQLPFAITGQVDESGQPWAGLLTGEPGFIATAENTNQFAISWSRGRNVMGIKVRPGQSLAMLGIELATRRRNRLNGTVFAADDSRWRVLIDQGYGNCPKYINERPWPAERFAGPYTLEEQSGLGEAARALTLTADTFFIATSSGPANADQQTQSSAWGTDVSHRGGQPGFVQLQGERLVFEDYPGNNMFNTLGNIARYPRCGLLLLDFDSGDMVQLAADAELVQSGEARSVYLTVTSTRYWRRATE